MIGKELTEVLARAEAAADLFVMKLSPFERDLFRESHRIAFIAGFVWCAMQERFPKQADK